VELVKEKKIKKANNLQELIDSGIPVHYVRFHQPVPPGIDKEPVSEFRIESPQKKYKVDRMMRCKGCLIFEAYGETDIVESANVIYSRVTTC